MIYILPLIDWKKGTILSRSNVCQRKKPSAHKTRIKTCLNPNGLNNKMEPKGPIQSKQIKQMQPILENSALIIKQSSFSHSKESYMTTVKLTTTATLPMFLKEAPEIFDDNENHDNTCVLNYPRITHESNPIISLIKKANIKENKGWRW